MVILSMRSTCSTRRRSRGWPTILAVRWRRLLPIPISGYPSLRCSAMGSGIGCKPVAELVVPVIHPKAYIPNHWDGLFNPFWKGMPYPFKDDEVQADLAAQKIRSEERRVGK